MFPAPAGMSPRPVRWATNTADVPRTCGDEPLIFDPTDSIVGCSPHLRG